MRPSPQLHFISSEMWDFTWLPLHKGILCRATSASNSFSRPKSLGTGGSTGVVQKKQRPPEALESQSKDMVPLKPRGMWTVWFARANSWWSSRLHLLPVIPAAGTAVWNQKHQQKAIRWNLWCQRPNLCHLCLYVTQQLDPSLAAWLNCNLELLQAQTLHKIFKLL